MADKFNDIKESAYASNVREPLGKGFERKYNWPDRAQNGNIAFGVPSQGLENAKDMLYPAQGACAFDDPKVTELYKKTHGNYQPGEQKNREYNWKFDPKTHRFGYAEKPNLNGAAKALTFERLEESYPKTVIYKKEVEDFKAVASDQLGKSKNLGQG